MWVLAVLAAVGWSPFPAFQFTDLYESPSYWGGHTAPSQMSVSLINFKAILWTNLGVWKDPHCHLIVRSLRRASFSLQQHFWFQSLQIRLDFQKGPLLVTSGPLALPVSAQVFCLPSFAEGLQLCGPLVKLQELRLHTGSLSAVMLRWPVVPQDPVTRVRPPLRQDALFTEEELHLE